MSDWLTYANAAARFGISAEAVRQLAMRHRWPRRKLNDDPSGRVQVLIPDDFEARPRTTVQRPDDPPSNGRPTADANVLLDAWRRERERADLAERQRDAAISRADAADADRRGAEARLLEQIDRERQRADQAFGMIDGFKAERDRAEQAIAGERTRSDTLRDWLDAAEDRARSVEQSATELRQADDARRGQGRWARLRAAWRGE